MKIHITILLLFSLNFISFSQHQSENNTIQFDGTYQIEIHNVRYLPNIPGNIEEIVSNHRTDNVTVFFPLDENIRIRIPSREELLDPNFQPLELVKYF